MKLVNILTALAALAVVSSSTLTFAQGTTGETSGASAPAAGTSTATKTTHKKHAHKHKKACSKKCTETTKTSETAK